MAEGTSHHLISENAQCKMLERNLKGYSAFEAAREF